MFVVVNVTLGVSHSKKFQELVSAATLWRLLLFIVWVPGHAGWKGSICSCVRTHCLDECGSWSKKSCVGSANLPPIWVHLWRRWLDPWSTYAKVDMVPEAIWDWKYCTYGQSWADQFTMQKKSVSDHDLSCTCNKTLQYIHVWIVLLCVPLTPSTCGVCKVESVRKNHFWLF